MGKRSYLYSATYIICMYLLCVYVHVCIRVYTSVYACVYVRLCMHMRVYKLSISIFTKILHVMMFPLGNQTIHTCMSIMLIFVLVCWRAIGIISAGDSSGKD